MSASDQAADEVRRRQEEAGGASVTDGGCTAGGGVSGGTWGGAADVRAEVAGPVAMQGWLQSREPSLMRLWQWRWCVVRPGQLEIYEDQSMGRLVSVSFFFYFSI